MHPTLTETPQRGDPNPSLSQVLPQHRGAVLREGTVFHTCQQKIIFYLSVEQKNQTHGSLMGISQSPGTEDGFTFAIYIQIFPSLTELQCMSGGVI